MSIKIEYESRELSSLFDTHLTDKNKDYHIDKSLLVTPLQSCEELNGVTQQLYQAIDKILVPDEELYAFLIGACFMVNHYYQFHRIIMPHDWVGTILLGSVSFIVGLLVYVPFSLLFAKGFGAIKLALWKYKNKTLVEDVKQLREKVKAMRQTHSELCENALNEKVYFKYMLNYDQMCERIKTNKTYIPTFYNHSFYKNTIDLNQMREKMKQAYLDKKATDFFSLYSQTEKFENLVEQAWVKFEAQDGEILEEKYQAFARVERGQPELNDII